MRRLMRSKRSEVADLFSVSIPILAQIAKNSEAEISAGPYNDQPTPDRER